MHPYATSALYPADRWCHPGREWLAAYSSTEGDEGIRPSVKERPRPSSGDRPMSGSVKPRRRLGTTSDDSSAPTVRSPGSCARFSYSPHVTLFFWPSRGPHNLMWPAGCLRNRRRRPPHGLEIRARFACPSFRLNTPQRYLPQSRVPWSGRATLAPRRRARAFR